MIAMTTRFQGLSVLQHHPDDPTKYRVESDDDEDGIPTLLLRHTDVLDGKQSSRLHSPFLQQPLQRPRSNGTSPKQRTKVQPPMSLRQCPENIHTILAATTISMIHRDPPTGSCSFSSNIQTAIHDATNGTKLEAKRLLPSETTAPRKVIAGAVPDHTTIVSHDPIMKKDAATTRTATKKNDSAPMRVVVTTSSEQSTKKRSRDDGNDDLLPRGRPLSCPPRLCLIRSSPPHPHRYHVPQLAPISLKFDDTNAAMKKRLVDDDNEKKKK
jgi:hypothetical protein